MLLLAFIKNQTLTKSQMAAYETYETDATYDDMEVNPSTEKVNPLSCSTSFMISSGMK